MNPIERLIELFEKFPGIGPRQARRFVQYLLVENPSYRTNLADAIRFLGSQTSQCKKCFRWFASKGTSAKAHVKDELCSICSDTARNSALLFVVEKDADIDNVERSGFKGLYFVLGGTIPLAAEDLERYVRIRELLRRVESEASPPTSGGDASDQTPLDEIILGLSATTEGDHTRLIIQEKLLPLADGMKFKISSLGRGLSTGSELEYADPDTISNALHSRN